MLINLTDCKTNKAVAVNPKHVVVVFTASDGEDIGKTVIGVLNGSVLVSESYNEVVGLLQGELK
jgi:hypothetical protein